MLMPANSPAFRFLVLALALTAATGCPAPTQTATEEDEVRPVKAAGSVRKTVAPTGASTKPTTSTAPGASPGAGGTSSTAPASTNPNGTPSTAASTATSAAPSTAASTAVSTAPSTAASTAVSTAPSTAASTAASTAPSASPSAGASSSPAASVEPSTTPSATPTTGDETPGPTRENGGSVSAFAGNKDGQGLQNGTGVDALFQLPTAVAADNAGNVYVADAGNNAIRKITPAGVVSLVAGGSQGTQEGVGMTAQFNSPNGIAVADDGTIYVADTNNNRVRKIVSQQTSLVVGNGSGGQSLSAPYSVAVDRLGNLFIADTNNFRVLKVPVGQSTASVFAGSGAAGSADGNGAAAQFTVPASLTTDFYGNVYVADIFSLRKITAAGVVSTPQITGAALFSQLRIATDRYGDGSILYASDTETDQVYLLRRDDATGDYEATTLAGSTAGHAEGAGANAQFNDPLQLWVTSGGTLYIPDYLNNVIRRSN